MKKIISVILAALVLFAVLMPVVSAESDGLKLTLDVNKRNTDISIKDESDIYLVDEEYEAQKAEQKSQKIMYIAVLSTLLVIAVGILIYTLKKAPKEEEIEKNIKKEAGIEVKNTQPSIKEKDLKSEEKEDKPQEKEKGKSSDKAKTKGKTEPDNSAKPKEKGSKN